MLNTGAVLANCGSLFFILIKSAKRASIGDARNAAKNHARIFQIGWWFGSAKIVSVNNDVPRCPVLNILA